MNNIRLHSIVQKSIKKSSKKGYVDVKFRTRFINPLTEKRREILSDWYTVPNKADENGKIKISPQIKSLVYKLKKVYCHDEFKLQSIDQKPS